MAAFVDTGRGALDPFCKDWEIDSIERAPVGDDPG